MKRFFYFFIIFILFFIGGGGVCLGSQQQPSDLQEILNLGQSSYKDPTEPDNQSIRLDAIAETALRLGLQSGVSWRYNQINDYLTLRADQLNQIFDFSPWVLHAGRVLPPVITEARAGLKIESDRLAVKNDLSYKIYNNARFIGNPPTWRTYLIKHFEVDRDINPVMFPKNPKERKVWESNIVKGWNDGVRQADRIFDLAMAKIERDYRGMIRFHALSSQNIISIPIQAEGRLGVQIRGRVIDVDQRVFRITKQADWRAIEEWQPIVRMQDNKE